MPKMPKVIAIYLPQFHETEDNNRWWGKGFTDWETARTAESYFSGHTQPHIPLGQNYYDLSQKEVLQQQAVLADQYGIDGFCFYHYYFKDGKMELEKPAENLLKWKDIDMPFCFNWANASWVRSWSRISGNAWGERMEEEQQDLKEAKGVLALQDYGGYDAWVKHFNYLLPFFQDDRYIKIDGKPVFMFYNASEINVLGEMVACWRDLAEKAGLGGLYLIGTYWDGVFGMNVLDAAFDLEPRFGGLNRKGKVEIREGVRCFQYTDLWKEILDTPASLNYKTYWCGVTGYDDTPRRGKSGECVLNNYPAVFQSSLVDLIHKSMADGNELVFINAWNEWGESMYLEPDEEHQYAFLEAVTEAKRIAAASADEIAETAGQERRLELLSEQLSQATYNYAKFKNYYSILDKWLFLEEEQNLCLSSLLRAKGIECVAIYGMGAIGKHLYLQLKKEGVNVAFGIDQSVGMSVKDFPIYRPEEQLPAADAIIITAYDVADIKRGLQEKFDGEIYGIEEILDLLRSNAD